MCDRRQVPVVRVEWQARPGERELRLAQRGARGFDPADEAQLASGGKGVGHV